MDQKKFAIEMLKKRDTRGYIRKAKDSGYFIEAILRLDMLIDATLEVLFSVCATPDEKKTLESAKKAIRVEQEAAKDMRDRVLSDMGVLDAQLTRRIKQFKHVRNTMAHDVFGPLNLLLETKGEKSLEEFENNERKLLLAECERAEALLDDLLKLASKKIADLEANG
jgi:hypothetical protein